MDRVIDEWFKMSRKRLGSKISLFPESANVCPSDNEPLVRSKTYRPF